MTVLHSFLGTAIGGADGDLWWAAVRALTGVCSLIAAWAVRYSVDRYLAWVTVALGAWLLIKVSDDVHSSLSGQSGPTLNLYFLVSNLIWCFILIGLARMAIRERKALALAERVMAGLS
jgi:hypothetical protein